MRGPLNLQAKATLLWFGMPPLSLGETKWNKTKGSKSMNEQLARARRLAESDLSAEWLYNIALRRPSEEALVLLEGALNKLRNDEIENRVAILTALAATNRNVGDFDRSWRYSERAFSLAPENADVRVDRAYGLLVQGRYAEGFRDFEQRIGSDECELIFTDKPVWSVGENDATIIVTGEQGRGDQIMMVRFLEWEALRGNRIYVECHAGLESLFRKLPCIEDAFGFEDNLSLQERRDQLPLRSSDIDYELPFMSIANAVGVGDYSADLYRGQYLSADKNLGGWSERLGGDRFKVGLVWQGDSDQPRDRYRSIPIELIRPLLNVEGVAFFSLVVDQVERRKLQEAGEDFRCVADLGSDLANFDETAAVIANLDLVISVDTATAHLAGALQREVWVPLSRSLEWRWGLAGASTYWYPSMTLVRQESLDEWEPVIELLRKMLEKKVSEWRVA